MEQVIIESLKKGLDNDEALLKLCKVLAERVKELEAHMLVLAEAVEQLQNLHPHPLTLIIPKTSNN